MKANHSRLMIAAPRKRRTIWPMTLLAGLMAGGLGAQAILTGKMETYQDAANGVRDTYQHLAEYAGCAHFDSVGNFAWRDFPDPNQIELPKEAKVQHKTVAHPR